MNVRTALLVILGAAALFGLAGPPASAEPPCWKRLVEDWSDGSIKGAYPISCYRQALHRLPEDVRLYSSASDDIGRALASRIRATRRPAKARLRSEAASFATARIATPVAAHDAKHMSSPLILAGSLAALVAGLAAAGVVVVRRRSQALERRDRWTGACS